MKRLIVKLIKKFPVLYNLAVRVYYNFQPIHIKESILGAKVREQDWQTRHLRSGNDWCDTKYMGLGDEWVKSYWDSQAHPHRAFLIDKIASHMPVSSILEIGCNCAPNLVLLARSYPDIKLYGIDINQKAIEYGKQQLDREHITNVTLGVGNISNLKLGGMKFDLVFTDAVLIYVLPKDIREVIDNIAHMSNKSLILLERHIFNSKKQAKDVLGVYRYGCWQRDYVGLLNKYSNQITVSKITKNIWDEERWVESGALIEVDLK